MRRGPAAARELAGPPEFRGTARWCAISLRVGIERSGALSAMLLEGLVREAFECLGGLLQAALPLGLRGHLGEDGLGECVLLGGRELGGGLEGFLEKFGHRRSLRAKGHPSLDAEYTLWETVRSYRAQQRYGRRCLSQQNATFHLRAAVLKARDSALCSCTGSTRTAMATLNVAPDSCNG